MTNKNMNNEMWKLSGDQLTIMNLTGDDICPRSSCKSCGYPKKGKIYYYGGYTTTKDNCFDDLYEFDPVLSHMRQSRTNSAK